MVWYKGPLTQNLPWEYSHNSLSESISREKEATHELR